MQIVDYVMAVLCGLVALFTAVGAVGLIAQNNRQDVEVLLALLLFVVSSVSARWFWLLAVAP